MSGTVFVEAGADDALADAPEESDAAGAAEAVVGVALMLIAGVAAVAALGDPEFEVPELAGAPVPVDVPEGVHAAVRAKSERPMKPSERRVVMTRAWDDTSKGCVKQRTMVGACRHPRAASDELSFHRHTRRPQDQGGGSVIAREITLRT